MIHLLVSSLLQAVWRSSALRTGSATRFLVLALLLPFTAQGQNAQEKAEPFIDPTTTREAQALEAELPETSALDEAPSSEPEARPLAVDSAESQARSASEEVTDAPSTTTPGATKVLDSALSEDDKQQRLENAKELASLDIIELFDRANIVERELKQLRDSLIIPPQIKRLNKALPGQLKQLNEEAAKDLEAALNAYRWFVTTDIRFRFAERATTLESQREPLVNFSQALSQVPKRTEQVVKEWGDAEKLLIRLEASKKAKERVSSILRLAQVVGWEARKTETQLARSSYYFGQMQERIQAVLDATEEDNSSLFTNFTHQGVTPFEGSQYASLVAGGKRSKPGDN